MLKVRSLYLYCSTYIVELILLILLKYIDLSLQVFVVAVLAIFPLVPRHLSHRAYRLSFMGTACSSLFSLYSLYGVFFFNCPCNFPLNTWFVIFLQAHWPICFCFSDPGNGICRLCKFTFSLSLQPRILSTSSTALPLWLQIFALSVRIAQSLSSFHMSSLISLSDHVLCSSVLLLNLAFNILSCIVW